jgi:tetratricopeptide (TPR) repeat protein
MLRHSAPLNSLGNFYQQQGLYRKAEPFYQRALAIRERIYGTSHFEAATTRADLASLYDEQGLLGPGARWSRERASIVARERCHR